MPVPDPVLVQGEGNSAPRFRTAPWFILRKKDIKSKGTALVLSVLWAAIPDIDERRLVRLSSQEISKRSGLNCKPEALRHHLTRLEKLGYIKRYGNHKNRVIEILIFPEDDDQRCLTIPEDIFFLPISPTKKLISSIKQAFPKMGTNEICRRLGISHDTYFHNINHLQPPKESQSNPLKNPSEPPKESQPIGIGGSVLGLDHYPTDNKGHTPQMENLNNPSMEDEKNMHPTPIQENPNPFDYERYKGKSVGPPKVAKKYPPINEDVLMELQNEVFQHQYITTNKTPGPMAAAAKVVTALKHKNGLSSMLDNGQIELIIQTMSTGMNKHHSEAVRRALYHQFSDEERVDLYERLSNSMSEAYDHHGKGKMINLADAVWSYGCKGFCRIVNVWLSPPRLLRPARPMVTIPKELELPLAIVRRFIPNAIPGPAITLLKEAQGHYDKNILPFQRQMNMTIGFAPWVRGFLEFAYNKATRDNPLHPGWLKPTAPTFQEWEASYKTEARWEQNQRELGARARAETEMEDVINNIIIFMDVNDGWTRTDLLERWPEDLVRMAELRRGW